jgi:hypothetical protein
VDELLRLMHEVRLILIIIKIDFYYLYIDFTYDDYTTGIYRGGGRIPPFWYGRRKMLRNPAHAKHANTKVRG